MGKHNHADLFDEQHPGIGQISVLLTHDKHVTHAALVLNIDDGEREMTGLASAIAECGQQDVFRRSTGNRLALGRALVKMGEGLIRQGMNDAG